MRHPIVLYWRHLNAIESEIRNCLEWFRAGHRNPYVIQAVRRMIRKSRMLRGYRLSVLP